MDDDIELLIGDSTDDSGHASILINRRGKTTTLRIMQYTKGASAKIQVHPSDDDIKLLIAQFSRILK